MNKQVFNRLGLVFTGTILMGVGIEIIVIANQGFDSVSTLILGLMNYSPLPFGRWSQLISLVFYSLPFSTNGVCWALAVSLTRCW